jgi:recombinational DNA repair protein RecR
MKDKDWIDQKVLEKVIKKNYVNNKNSFCSECGAYTKEKVCRDCLVENEYLEYVK